MRHSSFRFPVTLSFFLISLFLCIRAAASTPSASAPILFFSDIVAGANSGNSDTTYSSTGGVYVTLYGNYLSNYSSITLNGSSCLTVVSAPATWLWYQRMIVKIGTGCSTGNFSITTPGGTWSGPMVETAKEGLTYDFTVTSTHIYYVSSSGSDSNSGTFSSPFATGSEAKLTMSPGDATYIIGPYSSTAGDPDGGCGVICLGGDSNTNCATGIELTQFNSISAYPGTTVTLGSYTNEGLSGVGLYSVCFGQYIFGELTLRGGGVAIGIGDDYLPAGHGGFRVVGNDISCDFSGSDESGCIDSGSQKEPNIVIVGNDLHDMGQSGADNGLSHAMYFGNGTDFIIAWNLLYNTDNVCRGVQIYSSTPTWVFSDVHIHDNIIHDTGCDAIGIYDTDPSSTSYASSEGATNQYGGGVQVYNNVLYNCGTEAWGNASSACLRLAVGNGNGTITAAGTDYAYNNTIYNDEYVSGVATVFGGIEFDQQNNTSTKALVQNTLFYQSNSNVPYVWNTANSTTYVSGTNNLAYGIGGIVDPGVGGVPGNGATCIACGSLTGWVTSNPLLTDTSITGCPDSCPTNLSLSSSSSPANGAGTTSGPVPTYDITGLVRPSPPSIGAYEYAAGTSQPPPSPPTNLQAAVN